MTVIASKGSVQFALQHTKFGDPADSPQVPAQNAVGSVNFNAGLPADSDTVTINAQAYTFKTTLTPAANEVLIGATAEETAQNLMYAINDTSAYEGTKYGGPTTANAAVAAVKTDRTVFLTASKVTFTGKAGNAVTLAKSGTNIVISGATLSGGLDAETTFNRVPLVWKKHRGRDVNYDAVNMQSLLPLEIGGIIAPTGAYKSGVQVGGGFTIMPRLENNIGDLLLAAFGRASVSGPTDTAAYTHTFYYEPTANDDIPWVAIRKHIPGSQNAHGQGVTGFDNKLAGLSLTIGQGAPVEGRCEFVGRVPEFENYPEGWYTASDYENFQTIPLGCKGYFKIPALYASKKWPVAGVTINLINNVTTFREEGVVGSYYASDVKTRNVALEFRFMYKWEDPELYQRLMTGAPLGTAWSPTPMIVTKNGSDYGIEVKAESPNIVTGCATTPYSLTIRANKVTYEPVGPIMLAGGQLVMQEIRATALAPDVSTDHYADFILVNGRSSAYSVPVQP